MPARASSIGVVFGGPSPEHDVSILTGLQAARALAESRRFSEVHALLWAKNGGFFEVGALTEASDLAEGAPSSAHALDLELGSEAGFSLSRSRLAKRRRLELSAVVVCCHGGPGEDGTLQGVFDLAGIAYSGPSAAGAALGMDKLASAGVATAAGISVLERILVDPQTPPSFPGPYIVKPRFGGSSIGIGVAADFETTTALARSSVHLRRGAVLEPYRPELFDLEIAVRSYPELTLSSIARPLRNAGGEILDYADKYVAGEGMSAAPRELPAQIPAALAERVRDIAARAARALGARGVGRVDFLSDGEALYFNEINTVPGSLARYLFVDPPLPFAELLSDLVSEALERPAAQFSSAGSDGLVLRDAQSIAAKLA